MESYGLKVLGDTRFLASLGITMELTEHGLLYEISAIPSSIGLRRLI
jgi:hypothetical protein